MDKKIVILNGSPRPNGNTSMLAKAFTKGAEAAGNTVTSFFLDEMDINGCKGCFGGMGMVDSPCTQKDDMEKIYPAYIEADVVVLASPLYFWNFSGQLRTAFDRLFAVAESAAGTKHPKKDCVLLMVAGGNGFAEVASYYDTLIKNIGWRSLGTVLAGGMRSIGAIEDSAELAVAEKLGAGI